MKICMISRAYPPRIGGTGSMLESLSKELALKGFKIRIVTQQIFGAKKIEKSNGIEIYRTPILSEKNEFSLMNLGIGTLFMTSKILNLKDSDIFHAHDISVAGFSAWLAKKQIKKPFVLKYGGDLVFEYLSLKKYNNWNPEKGLEGTLEFSHGLPKFLHRLQQKYFQDYNYILPNSKTFGEFLEKKLNVPKNKIKVIPNGVDENYFSKKNKLKSLEKTKLSKNKTIIFSASRLVEWKGIDTIIKAFSLIEKEFKKTELVIAGTGPEEQNLIKLVKKLKLTKKIKFKGNVKRNEIADYFNSIDIFILASSFEGSPNVLLEAMACGKACIVSNVKSVTEITGNSSLNFRIGNEEELAEKIRIILNSEKKMESLGKKARKVIEKKYSLKKIVEKYSKFYEKINESEKK